MPDSVETVVPEIPTFDSPKVAKARLPSPLNTQEIDVPISFFVPGGDILDDRLVTFLMIVEILFID